MAIHRQQLLNLLALSKPEKLVYYSEQLILVESALNNLRAALAMNHGLSDFYMEYAIIHTENKRDQLAGIVKGYRESMEYEALPYADKNKPIGTFRL